MEENEYIRTDLGEIAIVTSVAKETLQDIIGNSERIGINEEIGFCNTEPYVRGNIIKHSKNIIDLIEIYDYVNSFLVFDIITYIDGTKIVKLTNGRLLYNNEIERVVTKEKFESVEYEVKKWK